ncbi:MAG: metal ABC transporter permease [Acidobacteriota bacterium]
MEAFIQYGFLQRALVAGVFVAMACSLLGVFLVLRKDAMIGHGLAHVSFAGVALGLWFKTSPLMAALILTVATAIVMAKIRVKAGLSGDTAIALFSSAGFALGLILVSYSKGYSADLLSYLFGDILSISPGEVWLSIILASTVVLLVIFKYQKLLFLTFDPETAKTSGVNVDRLDLLLTVLAAVTVVLGMKVVGILLVAALIVFPSASGLQLAGNFRMALILSGVFSVSSVVLGLWVAYVIDIPASGAIVFISFLFFLSILLAKKIR